MLCDQVAAKLWEQQAKMASSQDECWLDEFLEGQNRW